MKELSLKDKVAIVTGGAGGIGSRIATAFSAAGAQVVITSRKQDRLDKLAAEISEAGGDALAVSTDVCDAVQVDRLVQRTMDRFGRIDVLVNSAGGALHMKRPELLSPYEWKAGIALNLSSVFFCSAAAGKVMIEQDGGKIINISSVAGLKDSPAFVHYGAAKAGVVSLTRSLAAAWAKHNITVNCIAPGLTATEGVAGMLPPREQEDGSPVPSLQFPPDPEHVANLAVFLASSAADHITGEMIPIRAMVGFDR